MSPGPLASLRLQGEAIPDAWLVLWGRLDETPFGEPIPIHLTPFMDGRGRPQRNGPLDGGGRRVDRTAVRRNFVSPFMLAFDTPIPFSTMGRRNESNVAAQALILMNDPFVVAQTQARAQRAMDQHAPAPARIEWMYLAALARRPTPDEVAVASDFLESQMTARGVNHDDRSLWADLAHALASISKHITATAVLLLVDRGKLAIDDTLNQFFADVPEHWQRIDVHHLLTHTSGLPDYEALILPVTTLQLTDDNVLAILRGNDQPLFEPGAKFAYSNSGYTLLGLIVEAVAARPLHRFVRDEVFAPTELRRSVLFVEGMNSIPERAFGHEFGAEGQWMLADQSVTSAIRGDGGVYSSLDDLERWLRVVDGMWLLSDESHRAMLTPHVRTHRGHQDYGYGWLLDEYRGQRRVMHGGSTRGFATMLQRFPERRAAVVILLNRSRPKAADDVGQQVVDLLLFERQPRLSETVLLFVIY